MIARRALVAAMAVVVLAPAGCSDGGPGKGEARLEVDGQALVERRDGDQEMIDDATTIGPGDRVELTDGVGSMTLSGGARFELRSGVGEAGDSVLVMGEVPVLESGDLLVSAPRSTTVAAAGTQVAVEGGVAQVSRSLGMGVAAYDAEVLLDSAGQERTVPALREMRVPALGRPPQAPRPLAYDNNDPWDRRFLGSAIELGDRLEALADGYTQNLREGEGRTPGFFRLVLPGLDDEPDFDADLIDLARPPGETLIGAAITDLGRRGRFTERWHSVFAFKDAGARWGLVALDQAVSGAPLLGAIEQAVSSSPLAFVEPTSPATVASPPPTATAPTTTPSSTTSTPTTAPPSTSPPPPVDLPDEPLTPALEPVVDPVSEAVTGIVNGLLGFINPPPDDGDEPPPG
jgi:hypothetical protein